MNYWPLIVGTHPDNHVLHTFLSYNFLFPSLSTVTSLIPPTNDSPFLMDFTFGISKLHIYDIGCSKIITLTVKIDVYSLYSSVVIYIDNYCTRIT